MYKHILFATDLSGESNFLISKVRGMRDYTGAKLSIIHVIEPIFMHSDMYYLAEDIEGKLIEDARKKLVQIAENISAKSAEQIIKVGQTKKIILEVAKDIRADLIICGSHGRHGLSLLLGSTANAILHGANCDILTVRYQKF
jgi:universal stress protein A